MKTILSLLAALALLCGCASPPTALSSAPPQTSRAQMFGTLAAFGTFEMSLAPAYTRLAVLRHRAAVQLHQGRIGVDAARQIQGLADLARAQLDAAHSATLAGQVSAGARAQLAEAQRLIASAESLLEVRK